MASTVLTKVVCDTAKVRFFKQITTELQNHYGSAELFAILQKYDFSSKSQLLITMVLNCLVVCDTAKVRFFKQITTCGAWSMGLNRCLRYCKSTIFQANHNSFKVGLSPKEVVCDTAKVRFFKQITTDFLKSANQACCLRYCKSTIFQANHNNHSHIYCPPIVVCDTAKVRFFKQITTCTVTNPVAFVLFAILQKYDFSSKSQRLWHHMSKPNGCLRYCKSTIFQANHNYCVAYFPCFWLFAILQKYDFSSKSQQALRKCNVYTVVCDTAKVRFFKQITTTP